MSQPLAKDINYLISLAEEGRAAPPSGGAFGLWWGLLTPLVFIAHWGVLTGRWLEPAMLGWLWLSYIVIGSIGTFVIIAATRDAEGASAVNNRVSGMAWGMMGLMTGLYTGGVFLGVAFGQAPIAAFDTILGVAFSGYAIAHFLTGKLTRDGISLVFALISAIGVLAVGYYIGQPVLYLIAAAFAFVTAFGSGVHQMAASARARDGDHG